MRSPHKVDRFKVRVGFYNVPLGFLLDDVFNEQTIVPFSYKYLKNLFVFLFLHEKVIGKVHWGKKIDVCWDFEVSLFLLGEKLNFFVDNWVRGGFFGIFREFLLPLALRKVPFYSNVPLLGKVIGNPSFFGHHPFWGNNFSLFRVCREGYLSQFIEIIEVRLIETVSNIKLPNSLLRFTGLWSVLRQKKSL